MSQLFSGEGWLFSYREFLSKYNVPVTPKEFSIVFDAVPSGTIMLFRNTGGTLPISVSLSGAAQTWTDGWLQNYVADIKTETWTSC